MASRTVVLDLDGTVWDSRPWYAKLAGHGDPLNATRAQAALTSGTPAARLLKDAGYTSARFRLACQSADPPLTCFPGVILALEQLRDSGVKLAVATNLPSWIAGPMTVAHGISGLLTTVVDYAATSRHKPHPAPLLEALRRLGTAPGPTAWYVGDEHQDAAAARAGGLQFAWASWGAAPQEPEGTSLLLREPADLATLARPSLEEALWLHLALPEGPHEVSL